MTSVAIVMSLIFKFLTIIVEFGFQYDSKVRLSGIESDTIGS